MKQKVLSLCLTLALCLGLTIPAAAAEQKITVGEKTYDALLQAILSETEADSVTARLDSDVTLTAAVVVGSSDYNGLFDKPVTVTSKKVIVDLNGYTLTGAKDSAVFEVQEGYTLKPRPASWSATPRRPWRWPRAPPTTLCLLVRRRLPWSPRSPSIPLRTWRRPLPIMMPFCGRWNRESPKAMRTGLSGREPPAPTFIF